MKYKNYFKVFIKRNAALFFSIFIAFLTFTTLPIWSSVRTINEVQYIDTYSFPYGKALFVAVTFASLLIVSILPLITLRSIYNSNDLDTYFSVDLPKEKMLFFDMLNTYLLFLIPYVIFAIVNGGIVYLGINKHILYLMPLHRYIIYIVALALMAFFCLVLTTFIMTSSTNLGSAVIYSAVGFLLPSIYWGILKDVIVGPNRSPIQRWLDRVLDLLNPFSNIGILTVNENFYLHLLMVFIYAFLAIVLIVWTFKNFSKYKVENINSEEQLPGFYGFMTYAFGIGAYSWIFMRFFKYSYNALTANVFVLVLGLVAYYAVMMVRGKGKVNWSKFFGNYILISAIGLILGFLLSIFTRF